jgi:two-component system sensor histidine kinase/response regulator
LQQSTEILIDQIPLGILTFSGQGKVEFINQNFHKLGLLFRFNTSLLNINIFKYNLFPPTNIIDDLKAVLEGKSFVKQIKHIKTNDGRFISLLAKGSPIYEDENITGGMLIIQDLQFLSETHGEIRPELTDDYINKGDIFLIVTDVNGDIKYSAGKEIQGFNLLRKEITGKNIGEIFNPPVKEKILDAFKTAVQHGKIQFLHLDLTAGDQPGKFDCNIEPVIGESGFVQIVYLVFKIGSEAHEDIHSIAERLTKLGYYEAISQKQDTGFILIDNEGKIIDWDEQFGKISEIEKNDRNKLFTDLFPSLNPEEYLGIIKQLDETNSCELITNLENKKSEKVAVNLRFFKAGDKISEIIIVCTRLKMDSPVIKQEEKKKTKPARKIEEYTQPLCRIDKEGTILGCSPAFNLTLGYSESELEGKNFYEAIIEGNADKLKDEISALVADERKFFLIKIEDKNKKRIDANLIFEIEEIIDDRPLSINCFIAKIYEAEVISPAHIYQSLFKAAKDGMAVELDEKIMLANDSFATIFGYDNAKELEDKNVTDLIVKDDVDTVSEYLKLRKSSKQAKERIEFHARKKDGSTFIAEFYAVELTENGKSYVILIAKDITETRRMQEAAKDSEQRYRNIAENIDDLLYTFEKSGNKMLPTFYSAAIEKITGFTQAEFLSDQRLFLKIIHPDDFHEIKKRLAFLWKNNTQVTSEFEFRIINKSGNVVWVRNKLNVVRDSEGKIQKIYGLISDITFHKRAEEELKQSAANLKKLNDAKDRFLSIISHDLRAPFSSILGFTDLLLEDDTLSEVEKQQYITYIQDSSKSMLALVSSMLDWTRLQTGRIKFEPEKINARELIDNSINTISGTALKKGVEVENQVDAFYHLYVDKNLILQAFNNLLSNAVKFTRMGDKIKISANMPSSSRMISFSVKDTGIGIKQANLDKLFDIETKFTSEGTAGERGSGLGLSLVKEIVEKHGGQIDVKSEFGKGTEFIFTLPVASTKILLVDPNSRERLFYSKVLINITTDYAINVVSNGKEALERITLSPPALVITEHKMPVMNGQMLVRELIKSGLKESVPVIVLTGDIDRTEIQEYTDLGIEYIFNKPVNLRNFKEAIEKSLKKSY